MTWSFTNRPPNAYIHLANVPIQSHSAVPPKHTVTPLHFPSVTHWDPFTYFFCTFNWPCHAWNTFTVPLHHCV